MAAARRSSEVASGWSFSRSDARKYDPIWPRVLRYTGFFCSSCATMPTSRSKPRSSSGMTVRPRSTSSTCAMQMPCTMAAPTRVFACIRSLKCTHGHTLFARCSSNPRSWM